MQLFSTVSEFYSRSLVAAKLVNLVAAKPEVAVNNVWGCYSMHSVVTEFWGHRPSGCPRTRLLSPVREIRSKLQVVYIKFIPIFRLEFESPDIAPYLFVKTSRRPHTVISPR